VSPEAAKKRQDRLVGDNYLATTGDKMESHPRFFCVMRSRGENRFKGFESPPIRFPVGRVK
jgi:hypothetical protein